MDFFTRVMRLYSAFFEGVWTGKRQQPKKFNADLSPTSKVAEMSYSADYAPMHYPNSNMADAHAEIANIQQAYDKGLTKGQDMIIIMTPGKVCDYCFSDAVAMAKACELRSLTIHETLTGDKLYWEEGMTKFSVSAME